jgi:hypothetical protein
MKMEWFDRQRGRNTLRVPQGSAAVVETGQMIKPPNLQSPSQAGPALFRVSGTDAAGNPETHPATVVVPGRHRELPDLHSACI